MDTNNAKAHRLSANAEIKLLKLLKNAKLLGWGSSRCVFEMPGDPSKVVKLAIGTYSLRQNKLETRLWNDLRDNRLATITDFGRFVLVMEKLDEVCDDESFYDDGSGEFDEPLAVYEWLNGVLGETSDNFQLGVKNGQWKCYDYGFDAEVVAFKQVGNADYGVDLADRRKIIDAMIALLRQKQPVTKLMEELKQKLPS